MIVLHPTFHTNFVQFIKEFNVIHDYFECHELLEDYWKEIAPRQKSHPLAALILLSTSMYHWRRGNITGAIKTITSSIRRLEETKQSPFYETIDYTKLLDDAKNSLSLMKENQPFKSFSIKIENAQLLTHVNCLEIENTEGLQFLIHKHMLRDRSEILKEREKQKKRRNDL